MVSTYPLRLSLLRPPLSSTFATRPVKLTEANVVDDAYRAANGGIQGDGLLGNQTTGIWPAATNLNDNGNATTNLTGVTDHSSTTTRATTGVVKFGATAFEVVSGNAAANEGPSQPINGGLGSTKYTISAWVWLISGAATVRATLSDTVAGKQGGTAVVLTATPQKVTVTATTGIAGITEASYIETTVQQAGTWRIGGWQVETGAVATPYIATDGGDATRGAGRVQVPVAGLGITPRGGCIVVRAAPGWANTAAPSSNARAFQFGSTSADRAFTGYSNGTTTWDADVADNNVLIAAQSGASFAAGTPFTVAGAWDLLGTYVSVNGVAPTTTTPRGTIATSWGTFIDVGSGAAQIAGREFAGNFYWVAFFPMPLSASQYAFLNNFGNTPPRVSQLRQVIRGRVGVWDCHTGTMQVSVAA